MNIDAISSKWKADWALEVMSELTSNILSYWSNRTVDERGGFVGEIDDDNGVVPDADKSLVLNTRILWTFSAAYRLLKQPEYLALAERAYHYLLSHFYDQEHGGFYWMVHPDGEPSSTKKQVYGQAFAIYAFSEYYRVTSAEEPLNHAIALFAQLEDYSRDKDYGGYVEAHSREWRDTGDFSLSGKDLNEKKSMNTHLHVMEAYTNLYRVWPSEELGRSLSNLILLTINEIVDGQTAHFKLFFDEQWSCKSDHISYGHDIEGSWLLVEAAEVLGDAELLAHAKETAIRMAEAVLHEGIDPDGGIPNEADASGIIDGDKDWWPQAEAVVGFYNAYEMTGDERYVDAARASWAFIQQYIVDKDKGEWHWSVTRDRIPTRGRGKVNAWKCPYHNGRACLEMLERLGR